MLLNRENKQCKMDICALWPRTLKILRTLKKIFQSALNLGLNHRTLNNFFEVRSIMDQINAL